MTDRPLPAAEASKRMRSLVGEDVPYWLGTGDADGPTTRDGVTGYDCAGAAICYAYQLKRHRPGFAHGQLPPEWAKFADVEDDINTNSAIKDALLNQDLFRFVPEGELLVSADLIMYPTIRIHDADGDLHTFIGHCQMILIGNMVRSGGPYTNALIAHCHGPNGRRPAVTITDGHVMDRHDEAWPRVWSKAWALRVVE